MTIVEKEKIIRLKILRKFLDKHFPDATCALNYKNPLQLLVATIMSAQCADVLVNKVTANLFKKYKTAADFAKVPIAQLKKDIYPVTFYNNKAIAIKKMADILVNKYAGKVPKTMAELIELPGVARKTANVVLGHAYGIISGLVVDTHVMRVSQRYGLTNQKDPKKIEQDLMTIVPQKDWIKFSDQVILFGRQICTARVNRCKDYSELKNICTTK